VSAAGLDRREDGLDLLDEEMLGTIVSAVRA